MEQILSAIKKSCITISNSIRNQSSLDLGSVKDEYNYSGDNVKKLDLLSNDILIEELQKCSGVKAIGSEEEDTIIYTNNNLQ